VSYVHIPKNNDNNDNVYLRKGQFVDASVEVLPTGQATFNYDGVVLTATLDAFAPVSGGNFSFVGRTGGANDDQWVDNLRINCFTLAPPTFALQPVDMTVIEGDTAKFVVAVDGAPPLTLQWLTNGVPVPGATTSSYTTPPGTAALNGLQVSARASNEFGTTLSAVATLHVIQAPRIVSCLMGCEPNLIHVIYTKPVRLDGSYSVDISIVNGVSYGSSQAEVLVAIDPLAIGATATLTIQDVHDQGGNVQFPNPATCLLNYGFGPLCLDFNDNQVPPGTQIVGSASVGGTNAPDGILHLTDDGQNGVCGSFFIPDQNAGAALDRLNVRWKALIGGVDQPGEATQFGTGGADGFSLSWGSDVTAGCAGPEGTGSGVIVTVDTFDNGSGCGLPDCGGEAPAIEMKWRGLRVAASYIGTDPAADKTFLRKGTFVDAELNVLPNGTAQFTYDGVTINATLPGFAPITGGNFLFSASTGGAQDNQWIDDLCINAILPDASGPVLACPNIVAECSGGLTFVNYTVTAFDLCGGLVTTTCTPPSGTGFRLGVSNVTCTARDSAGNASTCTFTVTVVDTTPPVVNCPADVTARATNSAGTVVNYVASASDPCGLNSLNCSPPPGSFFLIGTTNVVCIAIDSTGNTNSCSFNVTVETQTANHPPTCVIHIPCASSLLSDGQNGDELVLLEVSGACAILDGSGSSDPDGDPLTFAWTVDGQIPVSLTASQEPDGGGTGSGSGTVTVSGNTLAIDIVFSGLSANSTATHIHGPAGRGTNAAVLYPLNSIATLGGTAGTIHGTVTLAEGTGGFTIAQQLQQLGAGLWYVNVHSTVHAGGEIRGQLDAQTLAGPVVTNCLERGCHTIVLQVSDGQEVSRCTNNVCVITACEAVEACIALVEDTDLARQNKRPLLASLKAACASFDRGDLTAGLNQLGAFQNKVRAQVAPKNPAAAAAFIECAQKIQDAVNCSAASAKRTEPQ
jgi:hypothetical protein